MPQTRASARKQKQEAAVKMKDVEAHHEKTNRTFKQDLPNMILLVVLCLAMGSVPFLLKKSLDYSEIAIFSLASYPYSLKLLWSPVVDSFYLKSFGRRKSWIIPIQFIVSGFLWYLGGWIDQVLEGEVDVYFVTAIFLSLVLLSATQDIAVDGLALEILADNNLSYASTCQTIGLNCGYFLSYTIFLAFHSASFCNAYLRVVPEDHGVLSLGSYMWFWSGVFIVVNLALFSLNERDFKDTNMKQVYYDIYDVISLKNMRTFVLILLTAKLGHAIDDVTQFKLLEKGWKEEDIGLASLINFPLQIIFGYYTAKWSQGERKLKPWLYAFYGRISTAALGMLIVTMFPEKVTTSYFLVVIGHSVLANFMSTIQFCSMGSFFAYIADPQIGGTYMTLLNTLSNFGGTYPQYFVLQAVDLFTKAHCSNGTTCATKHSKSECTKAGYKCQVETDGYYVAGITTMLLGITILFLFIKPNILRLERLSPRQWRVLKQKQ